MTAPMIDQNAALDRFLKLTAVPGGSGEEALVAELISQMLLEAGLDPSAIDMDQANEKIRIRGNCGNLIITLDGDSNSPRTMLSAHMDTVPICVGCDPVRKQDASLGEIVVSAVDTGLGADDRAGCAAILTAVVQRLKFQQQNPHARLPPAVVTFLIQEEVGLEGAKHLDVSKVGRVDLAFNFDGGTMETIRHGAIGGERIMISVLGHASHAGVAPEKGVSAAVIASLAIADLYEHGWLGKVQKGGLLGTSNVGVVSGGDATNVVMPKLVLRAEARSHDSKFRSKIVSEFRTAFEAAAKRVTDDQGRCGQIEFESRVDYDAFRLPEDHPSVTAAISLLQELGVHSKCQVANGGLDANWLLKHGIEAVTLGCGQAAIHTVDEHLLIRDFLIACQFATAAITR